MTISPAVHILELPYESVMKMEREDETTHYRIKVEGKVHKRWADWFSRMHILYINDQTPNPVTILRGPIPDQAALRGILIKLWDLNLTLVSVQRLDDDQNKEK